MKWATVLLLLGLCAWATADDTIEIPDDFSLDDFSEDDLDIIKMIEAEKTEADRVRESKMASEIAEQFGNELANDIVPENNPCQKMHCGAGRVCSKTGPKTAECICIPECPKESESRRNVCTNKNETWNSDCDVYRHRCLCDTKDPACKDKHHSHMHIDYYGPCKQVQVCSEEEMKDFPSRMRDWLFNIMRDLAERNELTEHYREMEKEAETDLARRWANAAVWKWCDLDGDIDRSVSRHELFPIRAPLVSLEHCIAPFLEICDSNNDHRISLKEWGRCLELDDSELPERCEPIQKKHPHLMG
ncbi:SPARC family protein [Megaselia abdita]